jgi:hypothetical protein
MDEKICTKCKTALPLTDFYQNKQWKDGLHPWCKTCFKADRKAHYEKRCIDNPPSHRWHRDSVRHTYFSCVNSPLQAYILGFLAADGNVFGGLSRIGIELSNKDYDLLTLIRDELAPNHIIRTRHREKSNTSYGSGDYSTLSFTSHKMVADLARFGIVPRKSMSLRWPTELPSHLDRDFLLGLFDGDGSITSTVNFGYTYHIWDLCSGSIELIQDVISIVKKHASIDLGGPYSVRSRVYTTRVTGSKAILLDEWLHTSGLGLARKRIANKLE